MSWMLLIAVAVAGEGERGDVIREIATGVEVNWTDLTLNATGVGRTGGTEGRKAIEQLARREVEASMRQAAGRVRVTSTQTLNDLESVPKLSDALNARVSHWVVTEARYYASGKVELDAQLPLQGLLKPYTLHASKAAPQRENQPSYSGVLLDARGSGAEPAWAPRILGPNAEVLCDGGVWEEHAVTASPAIYVTDPAHPAARRAGDEPFIISASSASGPDLILGADDAQRFRTSMVNARVLGEGTMVVVVDP